MLFNSDDNLNSVDNEKVNLIFLENIKKELSDFIRLRNLYFTSNFVKSKKLNNDFFEIFFYLNQKKNTN